jgi:glycerophosphoryl diester phosphodiesterase
MPLLNSIQKIVDLWFALLPRSRPRLDFADNALLIAHRGVQDPSLKIIENTHAAFQRALELKCWGIEFDVHACADRVLVVNHDPNLKRLWGSPKKICNISYNELHAAAPLIPSLKEVVERYGKSLHLFVELKSPFTQFAALAETLQPLTPCSDFHLLSLDERIFPPLHQYFPKEALLLVPVHNNVRHFFKISLEKEYGGVLGHYLLLKDKQIQDLKAAHQIAGVGFVDSKYSLYRELNRGLRFLFSNNINEVSEYLQELRQEKVV